MSATNVDYYCAGFDKDGKRVGSIICDFNPTKDKNKDKLTALIEKGKSLFSDATVVEIIGAEDYDKYVSGEYIRGTDGKPAAYVAPEPTAAEKKASAIATIKAKYQTQIDSMVEARVKAAMLGADTSKIDAQYKSVLTAMSTEIKNA
ncbi:hypothetical protein [uncultured Dialister sp.]|jgi:hypothetical protein|uniref:hypothetical protein n=1 Tax=uncultured Dialister sp. TaxID=278064 RepID=UPI00206CB406|nr:hypothetical protein [uncultured Dialister sp.]DAI59992.1 MAG TPA: hypothetical protein [Caudoviricetes sp.]